jgi:AraC-like DNA-binding protein
MATAESLPLTSHRGCAPAIRSIALKYPELSEAQIADQVGCSPSNVHQVLKTFLANRTEEQLRDFQQDKADIYDSLQFRILESITDEKLQKSPAMALVTAAAILEDKARLVRGQATGISMIQMLDVVEAIKAQRANPRTISASIDGVSPISADKRNDTENNK